MAFFDFVGEALREDLIEEDERFQFRLHQKTLRDSSDPFQIPDISFKKNFRFNKETALIIIDMISQHMIQNRRSSAIPVHLKILAALHFFATGTYQLTTGQGYNFALSQPSMSRCINEVTNIINDHLVPNWIVFPNSENKRNAVMQGFQQKYNFARCLGAIDCTHVAIISPKDTYPALPYYCRKGYYSINCQVIVDSNYTILGMNARFPGSTHDAAIWQASNIRTLMENLYIQGSNGFLIGDSGYPLQPFLLTPFNNPAENTPEYNFNHHFIRARNIVEKSIGVLKARFRCLLKHRVLNYDPVKAGKIVYSCGVLHNIARFHRDDLLEDLGHSDDEDSEEDAQLNRPQDRNWYQRGEQVRNAFVREYFNVV